MQREHDVLCHHVALSVHHGARGVLGFADDGGKAGAEQRVLHFLDDAGEARLDHLKGDRIDIARLFHPNGHHAASVITMFLPSSTRATWPGGRTSVASSCSMIAGPWISWPTSSRSR